MRKEIFQRIEIPGGIKAEIDGNSLKIQGPLGENIKKFNIKKLVFEVKEGKIIIGNKKATKKEKKMINTIAKHIKNMVAGVQKNFEYKLKICYSHFPINASVQNNELIIKNFLGEKKERKLKIPAGIKINVIGDIITISSHNKELAGQTSADIERVTKIRLRDRRVFQDGCYIISKGGKEI